MDSGRQGVGGEEETSEKALSPLGDADPTGATLQGSVVVFDGVCNLCNGGVQFIIDHERAGQGEARLRFAALQSDTATTLLLRAFGSERAQELRAGATGNGDPTSMVLLEDGRGFTHSTAALRIARHLRAPYRWLSLLSIVPPPIRDLAYRLVAKNRYRWFGKSESCRIPTPELRARFLA